jgi:hypothetical protein
MRLHDLRRSFATALGEAGVTETIADAILNHKQSATRGGVLGVYQRSARWPEQVAAMQRWGRLLAAAIEEPAPSLWRGGRRVLDPPTNGGIGRGDRFHRRGALAGKRMSKKPIADTVSRPLLSSGGRGAPLEALQAH